MPPRGRLPRRPTYDDLPLWRHNFDNVQTRIVNAAWNALFTTDLLDLSFKSLAAEVGVTPQALYHYYPSMSSLGAELACHACAKLNAEITDAPRHEIPKPKPLKDFVANYIDFAFKRQRHFALMLSPTFTTIEAVADARHQLARSIWDLLELELGAEPEVTDCHVFWGILHGAAALVAAGHVPHPKLVAAACQRHLDHLRKK